LGFVPTDRVETDEGDNGETLGAGNAKRFCGRDEATTNGHATPEKGGIVLCDIAVVARPRKRRVGAPR